MKSNQKGFTLIELLAVIVILAIIALIATPVVLNIIDKARTSAAEDSLYGTMDGLRLAYAEALLDTNSLALPLKVDFANDKILTGTSYADSGKVLSVSGTMPDEGVIELGTDGQFEDATGIKVNGKTCSITNGVVDCQ